MRALLVTLVTIFCLEANVQLIKKENEDSNTTLLVIGGIHGDEPGGYFAASILATNYKINSKNLWIVPNLNQASLQLHRRGIYGDMNRKFSKIKPNDKDIDIVKEIKEIIIAPEVSLVLNLHDGNGFYRKKHQGNIFNPNAWGQTCVIDQVHLDHNQTFGNLNEIAESVKESLNLKLLKQHHTFDVKNTNTKYEDETMQHSLTYYAVTNNKPAFAIESSKNLPSLSQKVFYQLLAIEEFMKIMDISYSRDFELNANSLNKILKEYGTLSINNNILLNLNNIKTSLSYVPLKSSSNEFEFSHPLGSVRKISGKHFVYIGHKRVVELRPQYFELATDCPKEFAIEVDGKTTFRNFASEIIVSDDFKVLETDGIRVNIIGYRSNVDESGIVIAKNQLDKTFSIDNNGNSYRVEFYKQDKFCSMLMVHFK